MGYFSVTQILREIKIGGSRVFKTAILKHFYERLHFLKPKSYHIKKLRGPKLAKMAAALHLLDLQNLFRVKSE